MDVQRTTDSLRGQFLISTPVIESGFFKSTVTYICEHGEAGAMGIVINKPLDLQLADIFEHLNIQPLLSHDEVAVLAGGCLLYTSPSPRDVEESRMPSSA